MRPVVQALRRASRSERPARPRFSAIAFRAISFVIGPIRNSRASRQ